MKKILFAGAAILVLLAGFVIFSNAFITATESGKAANIKEFNIKASSWKFEPSTITVKKGDKVRIIGESADVAHSIAIEEYNINLYLPPNEKKTVEFTADRTGTFVFRCRVPCGEGHKEMAGKLVVE